MWSQRNNVNPTLCGVVAACLTLGVLLSYYSVKFGLDHPPAATGDEPEYDSLGWELAHGHGFEVDYSNPQFREPYEQAAKTSELYRLTTSNRVGTIANRPPGLPFVMSLSDRLLGRQFRGIRIVNALSMAAICGMLVSLMCRNGGVGVALVSALLFAVVDTRTRLYGRAILTEALAAIEIAAVCWLLFRQARQPTLRRSVVMGVILGVALLTRTQIILWLPGLTLLMFWLAYRQSDSEAAWTNETRPESRWPRLWPAVRSSGIMAATTLLVAAPWMARNCVVLGEFMPLGSQGWAQLSAAFGDATWEHDGLWTNLDADGFFDGVVQPGMTLLEAEVAIAHESRRRALDWIAANPGKAIVLVPIKLVQEFRPRTIPEFVILSLSVLGAALTWRDLRTRILLCVVASCCVSIAMTWSVEGRFLVPLLFAQHGLIGLGLLSLWPADAELRT